MVKGPMKAYFTLTAGVPLRFEPEIRESEPMLDPVVWETLRRQYHGTAVRFVSWATEVVGPLDVQGRPPGIYADTSRMKAEFPNGHIHEMSSKHFQVSQKDLLIFWENAPLPGADYRLRDFPNPIEFYPDDGVKIVSPPAGFEFLANILRPVDDVQWYEAGGVGAWRYGLSVVKEDAGIKVEATRRLAGLLGTQLALVRCGNVRALYTDSWKFHFNSNQHEAAFWAHHGVSREMYHKVVTDPAEGNECWVMFRDAEIDLVYMTEVPQPKVKHGHIQKYVLTGHRLHSNFVSYRDRVRKLTERLYPQELASAA